MTDITPNRSLGKGRWDKALKREMVALSIADNYDDAKHEWIATGEVWWDGVGARPNWASQHPYKCLCGHPVVYHFEIHNTETGVRECVGSDHINSYLILRAIREETGLSDDQITDEMIEEWIQVRVHALKKSAWWNVNGDEFTRMFDEVKDLDLRVNVRKKGTYYDSHLRMMRPKTFIRKRSEGQFGTPRYIMASIVWRWNHPDNGKSQISTRGWPNQKLYNDLMMFFYTIEKAKGIVEKQDKKDAKRLEHLKKLDEIEATRAQATVERRQKVVETIEEITHKPAFLEACEYYGIEPFVPEQGKDNWEERFLQDIKFKMIRGSVLTEKQLQKLWSVLDDEKKPTEPASTKQKNYLVRLGYEGDLDEITKSAASEAISTLKKEKWG